MRVNVLGNGDHSWHYKRGTEGKLLICNMPPFAKFHEKKYMHLVW